MSWEGGTNESSIGKPRDEPLKRGAFYTHIEVQAIVVGKAGVNQRCAECLLMDHLGHWIFEAVQNETARQ